jgi:hypothetical protein
MKYWQKILPRSRSFTVSCPSPSPREKVTAANMNGFPHKLNTSNDPKKHKSLCLQAIKWFSVKSLPWGVLIPAYFSFCVTGHEYWRSRNKDLSVPNWRSTLKWRAIEHCLKYRLSCLVPASQITGVGCSNHKSLHKVWILSNAAT